MCVRGLRAAAAPTPSSPRPRSPSTRLGRDDGPWRKGWEKAPRRGQRPPRCFVLFSFCDPDLVCSPHGEMTLGPRILKSEGA